MLQNFNAGYRYDKYIGEASDVTVPDMINGFPVRVIGNKAFLSVKCIEHLTLPESITTIEDWAFAHMKGLSELVLPPNNISFGKKVFMGCDRLRQIKLMGVNNLPEGFSCLMVSALKNFPRHCFSQFERLTHPVGIEKWLQEYDVSLLQFLDLADEIGFEPAFIGWFDVEDVDDQKLQYIKDQKIQKIQLVFERLHYSKQLEHETKDFLEEYLRDRSDFVADNICEGKLSLEYPLEYLKLWQACGGLSEEITKRLLDKMSDADPEIKSFLIGKQLTEKKEDFFDSFAL